MRGQLFQMAGDFAASNVELEAAAAAADALEPWSVTETLTDYTVNDAVKAYAGEDYERAYLHYYMARNYIALDDMEGALVELRRLDEVFRKLDARYEDDRRYQDDGFIRYLSGLIYESVGKFDDARVDYKLALAAYDSGGGLSLGVSAPRGLRQSLARLEAGDPGETEIVVVVESGWAPYKREESVEVPIYAPLVPEELRGASFLAALVKIAYPEYVSVGPWGGGYGASAGRRELRGRRRGPRGRRARAGPRCAGPRGARPEARRHPAALDDARDREAAYAHEGQAREGGEPQEARRPGRRRVLVVAPQGLPRGRRHDGRRGDRAGGHAKLGHAARVDLDREDSRRAREATRCARSTQMRRSRSAG